MAEPKARVRNAADPEQVREAAEDEIIEIGDEDAYIAEMMGTYGGRYVMWMLLGWCRVYESIMETSAKVYYNAGQQDVGHKLMAKIIAVSPDAYLLMQNEAMMREKKKSEPKRKVNTDG